MIKKYIKTALQESSIDFSLEDDCFVFTHPSNSDINCAVAWDVRDSMIFFSAALDIEEYKLSRQELLEILNTSNYDNNRGNLECDNDSNILYRSSTFIPEEANIGTIICQKALSKFLSLTIIRFKKIMTATKYKNSKKEKIDPLDLKKQYFLSKIRFEEELDYLYSLECTIEPDLRRSQIQKYEAILTSLNNKNT